jgi:hypothetical protein
MAKLRRSKEKVEVTRKKPQPLAPSDAVTAYIDAAPEPARTRLRTLRAVVSREAPNAIVRMAYGVPTWHQTENLIHMGAFARHIGLYPGSEAIKAFADELESFSTSKGTIQLPHDRDLPVELVRRITRWRLERVSGKRPAKARPARGSAKAKAATSRVAPVKRLSGGNPQLAKAEGDAPVQAYIAAMPDWKRAIGTRLDALIVSNVPHVRKAVKWNSPFYGVEGQGWFLSFHVFAHYVKVTFFRGSSLRPLPPGVSKHEAVRYLDLREGELDEAQVARWVRQAAALPGWVP